VAKKLTQSRTWVAGVWQFLGFSSDTVWYRRSWMAGSLTPVMYWAIHTTLCSDLQSECPSSCHTKLWYSQSRCSQWWSCRTLRIWGPMPNLFSLQRWGKWHCRAPFMTMLVCMDHDRSLVMWTQSDFKLSERSTTAPPKWHHIPYGTTIYGHLSNVVHYLGKRVPFGIHPLGENSLSRRRALSHRPGPCPPLRPWCSALTSDRWRCPPGWMWSWTPCRL
jgi:hypothetical protein